MPPAPRPAPTGRRGVASLAALGAVAVTATVATLVHASATAAATTAPGTPAAVTPAEGTITGTVEISSALANRRPRFRIYAEPGPGALPPAAAVDERRNIVLYVERVDGGRATPAAHAAMRQENERFVPHVLPVVRGTTVDFPNEDVLFHNVFSLSSAKGFDLGRYPRGSARSVRFERSGAVQVFCHIHSDMSAVVLVLDNPYFASPDADGRFTIPGLPPGDYTVVAWHERIRPVAHEIHVDAGGTSHADFDIPLPSPERGGGRQAPAP